MPRISGTKDGWKKEDKMKKIIIGILLLCMLPITLAVLEVDEIKIYIDDDLISDADEDGGDIEIKRGEDLTIKIYFDNDWDNESYIRLKGEISYIDDGDDLIKWKPGDENDDWYEIDPDEKTFKTLIFKIPDDADYDNYDLELTIYYNQTNGAEGTWDYEWDVIVEKEYEDEKTLEEKLDELKEAINSSNEGNFYKLYNKCFVNLTECKSYRTTNEGYKTNYDICILARDSFSQQSYQCDINYRFLNTSYYTFINQTYGDVIIERDNYAGQRWLWFFFGGAGGFVICWYSLIYLKTKKKIGEVGTKESPPSMNNFPTIDESNIKNIPLVSTKEEIPQSTQEQTKQPEKPQSSIQQKV